MTIRLVRYESVFTSGHCREQPRPDHWLYLDPVSLEIKGRDSGIHAATRIAIHCHPFQRDMTAIKTLTIWW